MSNGSFHVTIQVNCIFLKLFCFAFRDVISRFMKQAEKIVGIIVQNQQIFVIMNKFVLFCSQNTAAKFFLRKLSKSNTKLRPHKNQLGCSVCFSKTKQSIEHIILVLTSGETIVAKNQIHIKLTLLRRSI